jgi:hypothetical protein
VFWCALKLVTNLWPIPWILKLVNLARYNYDIGNTDSTIVCPMSSILAPKFHQCYGLSSCPESGGQVLKPLWDNCWHLKYARTGKEYRHEMCAQRRICLIWSMLVFLSRRGPSLIACPRLHGYPYRIHVNWHGYPCRWHGYPCRWRHGFPCGWHG